ncbi:MAG: DUF4347 domain-containing protein, partial [Planctomycetia bacterium]
MSLLQWLFSARQAFTETVTGALSDRKVRKAQKQKARQLDLAQMEDRVMLSASPAAAVMPTPDAEVQAQTTQDGMEAAVMVADAQDNSTTIWSEQSPDGDWNVIGQRFDALDNTLSEEFGVNTYTEGDQYNCAAAMNSSGDLVLVWQSDGQDGDGGGIFAQRYDASGNAIGSEFRVNTTTAGNQSNPAVVMNENGDFLVAWTGQSGEGEAIFLQHYDANGNPAGSEFQLSEATNGIQKVAALETTPEGDFLVHWTVESQDGLELETFEQQISLGEITEVTTSEDINLGDSDSLDELSGISLVFEESTNENIDFLAQGDDYSVSLDGGNALFTLNQSDGSSEIYFELLGTNANLVVEGLQQYDLFEADHLQDTQSDLAQFGEIQYANVYDGVDLLYRGDQGELSCDLVVSPGADPGIISLAISGAQSVHIDTDGNLVLQLSPEGEELRFQAPLAYQEVDGQRQLIDSHYVIAADGAIGLAVADYDIGRSLTINLRMGELDPTVESTLPQETTRHEIVFVDTGSPDYQQLVDSLLANNDETREIEVVLLDAQQDGISQITEILSRYENLDAVHIISHGSNGTVSLGDLSLSSDNIDSYAEQISQWGDAFDSEADLLFYGCDLASGEEGNILLSTITDLTGADVAASIDPTGHESLGGDWDLEYQSGEVETTTIASTSIQENWLSLLTAAGITVTPIDSTTTEAGGQASFTVVLDTAPTDTVTIEVSSSDTTEGEADTSLLTFTTGDWSTPQTVTIDGVDDYHDDGNVAYDIILAPAVSTDSKYNAMDADDVSLTNYDDDTYNIIYVDTATDVLDGTTTSIESLYDNKGADGKISLREAITAANNTANSFSEADRIYFNIDGAGVHTISLASALPDITDAVIINGYTQSGASENTLAVGNDAVLQIEISGTLTSGVSGVTLAAGSDGSTICGLVINDFDANGILVNSTSNIITGNFIGTDSTGTSDLGNNQAGIKVTAANNTIGGTTAADRNIISGNDLFEIQVLSSDGTTIQGNYLGTNAAGIAAITDGIYGIYLYNSTANIGGTDEGAGNVIAGSSTCNVYLEGSGEGNTEVKGNLIGTNATATAVLGNTTTGIYVTGTAINYIGGTENARNVIGGCGTGIILSGASGNVIRSNFIGTDETGTLDLGNTGDGILITSDSDLNLIGFNAAAANTIAFNDRDGIRIDDADSTRNGILYNSIYSNTGLGINLGTDGVTANDTGDSDTGPNNLQNTPVITSAVTHGSSIDITGSLNSTASRIFAINFYANSSGDASGYGEGKMHLGIAQVTTDGDGDVDFSITLDAEVPAGWTVSAIACDLTTYDTSEFAQNVTVIQGGVVTVTPTSGLETSETGGQDTFDVVLGTAPTDTVTISITSDDTSEGEVSTSLLTFTTENWDTPQTVTITGQDDGDVDNHVDYTIITGAVSSLDPLYDGLAVDDVEVTNLDDEYNVVTVDTTSDVADGDTSSIAALIADKGADGYISLREAIIAANNTENGGGSADQILFNIAGTGVHTISVTASTSLPTITDAVFIDGFSQTGASANTLAVGNDAVMKIEITGVAGAIQGLLLGSGSDGSTIQGLVINYFSSNGIAVNSDNNVIAGNFIGTDTTGTIAKVNSGYGIITFGSGNILGGTNPEDRNVIVAGTGISALGTGNTIQGNYIGTTADGMSALAYSTGITASGTYITIGGTEEGAGNVIVATNTGISFASGNLNYSTVQGNLIGVNADCSATLGSGGVGISTLSTGVTIGGTEAGAGNVIGGFMIGINLTTGNATDTTIQGNFIGTDSTGTLDFGNSMDGIRILTDASDNLIGGTEEGAGNIIAFSGEDGIQVNDNTCTGNTIVGNSFYSNTGLGINLSYDGVTANDAGDSDTGPNNLQNFPVLTSAVTDGSSSINISGSLNSTASRTFRIEFFASTTADGTGYGEGETYLGYTEVVTDGDGNATISANLTAAVEAGTVISATATDLTTGDTSEFALNVTAVPAYNIVYVDTATDVLDGTTTSIAALIADKGADGYISLREAITAANNTTNEPGGADRIYFDIAGGGVHTISLASALPDITDSVYIDGYTQTGASENTLAVDSDAVLLIEISGTATSGATGLTLATGSDGSTIRGLVINEFEQNGISVDSDSNVIVGNFIGTNAAGIAAPGNGAYGISLSGTGNLVGGTTPEARNVISGNMTGIYGAAGTNTIQGNYIGTNAAGTVDLSNDKGIVGSGVLNIGGTESGAGNLIVASDTGIYFAGGSSNASVIQGNLIGVNATASATLGGTIYGMLTNCGDMTIGGTDAGAGNVIGGCGVGLIITGSTATNITVQGNYIGTNSTGTVDLGNSSDGISILSNAHDNLIGGTADGAGNIIAFSGQDGIQINDGATAGIQILGNSIYSNDGLGINLGTAGEVTANDEDDPDTGANNLQNFPVLTDAVTDESSSIDISGSLNSTASRTFRIEFFASTSADGTGYGEGETYLGYTEVITDGDGNATISANLTANVAAGSVISATATDLTTNDTSEFALNITATTAGDDTTPPVEVNNTGSSVAEGGTDTIASTELLFTDSEQPATSVNYTVTGSPTNGQLELTTDPGTPITSFTQDDIDNDRVVYVHDDSDTTADSFTFSVDDGQGNSVTGQTFDLTITAVDDTAP